MSKNGDSVEIVFQPRTLTFKRGLLYTVSAVVVLFIFGYYFVLYNNPMYYDKTLSVYRKVLSKTFQVQVKNTFWKIPGVPDIPPVQWFQVPENVSKDDHWVVLVSSAYFDHRINKVVVLMASGAAGWSHHLGYFPYLYWCQLFYDHNPVPVETEGYFFTSYIFYCPLPEGFTPIPTRFSLRRNDTEDDVTKWTIPIDNLLVRKNTVKPKTFAMCVGIMFGYQHFLTILQYIEYHRMQGAEKFIFFYHQMHPSIIQIFNWYKRNTDIIELVYWNPKHYICFGDYKCQLLRNNFCTYNMMYKYKYLANNDFDELFFPMNGTLMELIAKYDKPRVGSFLFRNKYHMTSKNDSIEWNEITWESMEEDVKTYTPLVYFNNVSTPASMGLSPKAITKPETVLKRWIHFVHTFINGTYETHIHENDGLLRHFKIRKWWGHWADSVDDYLNFTLVDPYEEVGHPVMENVISRVLEVAKRVKAETTEDDMLKLE